MRYLKGVEARDGIEPPNKALQTLPFSFWVPRRRLNQKLRVTYQKAIALVEVIEKMRTITVAN
jgi:hypothetical protein